MHSKDEPACFKPQVTITPTFSRIAEKFARLSPEGKREATEAILTALSVKYGLDNIFNPALVAFRQNANQQENMSAWDRVEYTRKAV